MVLVNLLLHSLTCFRGVTCCKLLQLCCFSGFQLRVIYVRYVSVLRFISKLSEVDAIHQLVGNAQPLDIHVDARRMPVHVEK